jgi:predicted RNA binding protein YcfA (HicA-like mRNA interferase family)
MQFFLEGRTPIFALARCAAHLENLGFSKRVKGGHHIYFRQGIVEIINLQSLAGGKAKSYQVGQIRKIIVEYSLEIPERPS